ncbi:glycosyltransferase [Pedobacter sp. HMF7647]|uniref:Glycosyltransferase n=1 Tax=Hufsiella arboris TaxID=2695275 RepID=A0A7K1YDZ6_9SPHI|nr:glycosyltransferase family A protein [Hufsiella arboris]MXV52826.1 glycosyltransferase [Hufsiella arboris]
MSPDFSIIVPCYNQAQFLSETLQSVLSQTHFNWECIIVDDGSPDNTEKIALEWVKKDRRFVYLKKENGGLSSARNAGIKIAKGEFILPLDADDYISSSYLGSAKKVLFANDHIKLVYGNAIKFGAVNCKWELETYSYHGLLEGNLIYCSAIYRKKDFDNTNGYDESMKSGYEDWDFWLQLLTEQDKVHFLEETVFFYRIKNESMLQAIKDEHSRELRNYIYNKYKSLYEKYWDDPILVKRKNSQLTRMYKNSLDYKLGNFLINPLRRIVK